MRLNWDLFKIDRTVSARDPSRIVHFAPTTIHSLYGCVFFAGAARERTMDNLRQILRR